MSSSYRLQTLLWIAFALCVLWLLRQLSPILTPFLLGGILAYICNPLVQRLQNWRIPHIPAVLIVIVLLGLVIAGLLLLLIPLIQDEINLIINRGPDVMSFFNDKLTPWLRANLGLRLKLDPATLRKLLNDNFGTLQSATDSLFSSVRVGGLMVLSIVTTVLLAPVVLFYLLLDWQSLLARIEILIPRNWHARIMRLMHEVDAVLSEFLRGQILVMLLLALYYSSTLWFAGIPSAVSVGILTGLLIFIPYIGYFIGFALALILAGLQFEGFTPIMWVLIIYGIGQVLEGVLLTPWLVGHRIGLHPLAVLFALFAFGQLFGFVGVLLALPASAILLVALRELSRHYMASQFYSGIDEA